MKVKITVTSHHTLSFVVSQLVIYQRGWRQFKDRYLLVEKSNVYSCIEGARELKLINLRTKTHLIE